MALLKTWRQFPKLQRRVIVILLLLAAIHLLSRHTRRHFKIQRYYNLMKENMSGKGWPLSLDFGLWTSLPPPAPGPECTIDYANANRLQQDHPCVIELIRSQYLYRPSSPTAPLNLSHPEVADPSAAQSKVALTHLHNQTGGFFVESGAFDGEFGSNTLFMERHLQWKGILIEPDRKSFDKLLTKQRHSWALPVCLATEPYPMKVSFESNYEAGKIFENADDKKHKDKSSERIIREGIRLIEAQCFPLYSILLAVGRTRVDYFSLDVEGAESRILSNVPWHLVDIKTLTVEITSRKEQVVKQVTSHMWANGFNSAGLITGQGYYDLVFVNKRH